MDRNGALTRYNDILKITYDWLNTGYADSDDEFLLSEEKMLSKFGQVLPSGSTDMQNAGGKRLQGNPARRHEYSGSRLPPDQWEAFFPKPHPVRSGFGDDQKLKIIADQVHDCRQCNLHLIRSNTVAGIGPVNVPLMIVTPPPWDRAGEQSSPLAPDVLKYLGKWLAAIEFDLERDTYMTPAVKCRTPKGRMPYPREAACCAAWTRQQIHAVAPKAILALGSAAYGVVTGKFGEFGGKVGKVIRWADIPLLVLWAPEEVLAFPQKYRRPVWDSLKKLKAIMNALS